MARARRSNKTEAVLNNIIGTAATEEVATEQRSFATTEEDAKAEREAAATQQESVEQAETATGRTSSVAGKPSEEEIYKFLEKVGDKISYDSKSTREVAVVRTAVAIVLSNENVRDAFLRVVDSGLQDWLDRENLQSGTPEYKEIELVAYHFEGGPAAAIVAWDKPNAFLADALWVAFQESKMDEGIEKFYDTLTDFDDDCGDGAKEFFRKCEEIVPAIRDELTHFRKTPVLLGSKDPECVESASEFHANILSKLAAFLVVRSFFDDVKVSYDVVRNAPAPVEEERPVVDESTPHGKSAKDKDTSRNRKVLEDVVNSIDFTILGDKRELDEVEKMLAEGDVSSRFVAREAIEHGGIGVKYSSAKEFIGAVTKDCVAALESTNFTIDDVIWVVIEKFKATHPHISIVMRKFADGEFDNFFSGSPHSTGLPVVLAVTDQGNKAPQSCTIVRVEQVSARPEKQSVVTPPKKRGVMLRKTLIG